MERRVFSGAMAASARSRHGCRRSRWPARRVRNENLLILVELKGGNDGLNTVVPYADADYYAPAPALAIARDQVLQLDARAGLNPCCSR